MKKSWLDKYAKDGKVDYWDELTKAKYGQNMLNMTDEQIAMVRDTNRVTDDPLMIPGSPRVKAKDGKNMQKGRLPPIYVSSLNDPRLQAYKDSLDFYNQAKSIYNPNYPKISRDKFVELNEKNKTLPYYSFDTDKYKTDKAKNKVNNFEDYIYRTDNHGLSNQKDKDAYERNVGKHYKDTLVTKYLEDGTEKIYTSLIDGKLDTSEYTIFDPRTKTSRHYSDNVMMGIYNPNIKPTDSVFTGEDKLKELGRLSLSSKSTGWYDSTKPKPQFKSTGNKEFINETYPLWKNYEYREPVQPIVYQKDPSSAKKAHNRYVYNFREDRIGDYIPNTPKLPTDQLITKGNSQPYQPQQVLAPSYTPKLSDYSIILRNVNPNLKDYSDEQIEFETPKEQEDYIRNNRLHKLSTGVYEDVRKYKQGGMIRRADGSYSQRGLWDNIRANAGSGKKPTKEMLKQEKKIRAAEKKEYGGRFNQYEDGGQVNSIVDYLAAKGQDFSKPARLNLAKQYNVENYDFSAAKNIELLNKIKSNPTLPTELPTPVAKNYVDWDTIKRKKSYVNNLPDEEKIKNYYFDKPDEQYLVVDKKKSQMNLYQGDKLLRTFEVGTGKNKGDAQTVTNVSDGKVNWSKGNWNTGAGIYTIDQIDPANKHYSNLPSFSLKNEKGIRVSNAIHAALPERLQYYGNDNLEDNRMSNGCINGKCEDVSDLYYKHKVKPGTKVFILPEENDNRFVLQDNRLIFKSSAKNRNKYKSYIDSEGNVQKGQGINTSENTINYSPIRILTDKGEFQKDVYQWNDLNDENEYQKTTKPFIQALVDNKQAIMKAASISSDVYNDIAKISFGIYGTESNFGDTHSAMGNFLRAGKKFFNPSGSSSPDYQSKYNTYGANEESRSAGLTQLRWNQLSKHERDVLQKLGITSNKDFLDPTKAAVGTAAVLGVRYNEQLNDEQKKDIYKNLPKRWNSRENYPDRVLNNSRYINIQEYTDKKYQNGGMIRRADGSYSQRGLWDNIRANAGSGKKPTKEMLQQEKKIKAAEKKEYSDTIAKDGKLLAPSSPYLDMDPAMLQGYQQMQRQMEMLSTPEGRRVLAGETYQKDKKQKANKAKIEDKETLQRMKDKAAQQRAESDPSMFNPSFWKEDPMSGRTATQRLEDMGTDLQTRVFQTGNKTYDSYLNTPGYIAHMAGNLAKAPAEAQRQNSVMPYVSAIGEPLLLGTGEAIAEPYVKKAIEKLAPYYGQFVKSLKSIGTGLQDVPRVLEKDLKTVKEVFTPGKIKSINKDIEEAIDLSANKRNLVSEEYNKIRNLRYKASSHFYDKEYKVQSDAIEPPIWIKQSELENKIRTAQEYKKRGYVKDGDIYREVSLFEKSNENNPIINFATGETVMPEIVVPGSVAKYSKKGKNVSKEITENSQLKISEPYQKTVQSNIDHIENLTGGKVYGSAKGVASADFPHTIGDYDVFISEANYKNNVEKNLNLIADKSSTRGNTTRVVKSHSIDPKFGKQGEIDFNIVEADPTTGKAKGPLAEELFRQFAPDEFGAAAKENIKTGKPLQINYSPDELIEMADPSTKTILDAYEAGALGGSKEKHILKIDRYINYGDPAKVATAQNQYIKSIVGSKGTVGHQFPIEQLSNPEMNKQILSEMAFSGDIEFVANNPQRMQLALNDYYINNTVLSRGINPEKNLDIVKSALTEWDPQKGGGTMMGAGLNNVMLGESGFGEAGIYSNKQLSIKKILRTEDPFTYVNTIKKATDGNVKFTIKEAQKVVDILEEQGIQYGMSNIRTPKDLIHFLSQHPKAKTVLDQVSDATGIRIISTTSYGNSKYASTIGKFDDEVDAILYAAREYVPRLKSLTMRNEKLKSLFNSNHPDVTEKQFHKLKNYLTDAEELLTKKLNEINKQIEQTNKNIEFKTNKFIEKKKNNLIKLQNEYDEIENTISELHRKRAQITKIRENFIPISAVGTLGVLGTIAYKNNNKYKETREERLEELKKRKTSREKEKIKQEKNTQQLTNSNFDKKKFGGSIKNNWLQKY